MTLLAVAFILIGLFALIAAVAYAGKGCPIWVMATVMAAAISGFAP